MPVFILKVKKGNSPKRKTSKVTCFLINYKFFVSVVTLYDICFILDLNDFLALMFSY